MQRYHAPNCNSAVNNSTIGGPSSARDGARADSSSLSANFSLNSRRQSQLTPYKLKCDKESLNSRLGPPDFYPQTPTCPEETLTQEYVQHGYRETVVGLEDAREISLTQNPAFSKPTVLKCKEAIRKRLRAINESRAQKRKAGQVYGVPLSGSLLNKPCVFPEQRPCGEDLRKKWIEGLCQHHKRLRSLVDHVPHGFRKKNLFEVLIRNNVPLLRATWFIKVTYLNQVRPATASVSSGSPDKSQLSRTELWTKDVIDYLHGLLEEFFSRNSSHSTQHSREKSQQILYAGSIQPKSDPVSGLDSEEPSLHFKWWYVVRILQWHHAEGLILPSLIIDWALRQLQVDMVALALAITLTYMLFQDKELLEILQLLLPVIYGVIETVVLSQTYVRALVGVAVRFIKEPSPGGSDLVDNSRRAYTSSALVEMLRFLILAVPDTFVALDCFPLPPCVVSHVGSDGNFLSKVSDDTRKIRDHPAEVPNLLKDKVLDGWYPPLSFDHLVSSIQKRADNLAKAASPGYPCHSEAKAVQALDKALLDGDVRGAYKFLFDDHCDGAVNEGWIAEVSPCLRSSLKWIGTVSSSLVCSVFFLCEWATCDFRDFRTAPRRDVKFSGRKDFSQVFIAIRLLKLKLRDAQNPVRCKNNSSAGINSLTKGSSQPNISSCRSSVVNVYENKNNLKHTDRATMDSLDIFQSPGPLHDIIVCWIDQHEAQKGEGFKRLQLLIMELARSGIFYPQAYVRQLIVSGIMDRNGPVVDLERRKRHHQILKQLPGSYMRDALEGAQVTEVGVLSDAMLIYSNERRLVLQELLWDQYKSVNNASISSNKPKHMPVSARDGASPAPVDQWRTLQSASSMLSGKTAKSIADIEELKAAISGLLQLPNSCISSADTGVDESQGSVKKSVLNCNKMDLVEGTPGCEECRRAKKQKLSEERSSYQGHSPNPSDDEDTWWVRKGPKSSESFKIDPPLKTAKQTSRGRQKIVRKTQSLAQLAAARIEGSQGASTSHVCDSRISCIHHRTGMEGEGPKPIDEVKTAHCSDIVSIGKALKQLRFMEKRTITMWLATVVRQFVEENEKTVVKGGQFNRSFPVDDRSSLRWKFGEEELSSVLYLMDVCNDLISAAKFLLWLLPKVLNNPTSTIHGGRSITMLPRNLETAACEVGEAYLLSCIRRYENILVATDLIPEALSATVLRAATVIASNGRVAGSSALVYARYLLKKYGSVSSVIEWERNFKSTGDKRLISELESGRPVEGEFGFPLGVPSGVEDLDEFFRQKISNSRISRVGLNMKDIVQRNVDDAVHYLFGKERKLFAPATLKAPDFEKLDDGYQMAHQIVIQLMDCMRHTGGAAQEGDPSLVSSAVAAIVCNAGPTIAKVLDFSAGNNYLNFPSTSSLNFARRILRIHVTCLSLLKEALGERQSRVFEIALAAEASSALAQAFAPVKAPRSQFQLSPEAHDSNSSMSNEIPSNSAKGVSGRATKTLAAVSALVIGAVIHGVIGLERMVTVFRLKEGLDAIQFIRSTRSNSNGNPRSLGAFKMDNSVEVCVHWFRLLIGNCRTVCDGLVVDLVGEPSIVALSRMQRTLPLSLVLPPAYAIFSFVVWKPFILNANITNREDIHQLYQSLTLAISDAIRHLPFRDVCMRDTHGFYDLVAADGSDSEFAAMLELNGPDLHLGARALVPLRARLFLNTIIDCKMPNTSLAQDDGTWVSGHAEPKIPYADNETKLLDKLVHILDTLQPAKFHWQWVELRLLLNEQAIAEKLDNHDVSLAEAIHSVSSNSEKAVASENENNFILIILTRLLVRPYAGALFSEVVHLFGRSLEDSTLLQAKWFLGGHDVLFGRKSIRQRLINIAESKGLSTKVQFWKPWGWSNSSLDPAVAKGDKKKLEITSLEEGEVVEEGTDSKRYGKGSIPMSDFEGLSQQHATDRALVELVLPCIDQSCDDSRNAFANDLIKQMHTIEQQINAVVRGTSKQSGTVLSGVEGPANKGNNNRKVIRGSSPGLARRPTGVADSAPPSPAALRASMALRLQFLLRLLPVICAEGEQPRSMRHFLASVILRLLGSRVVYEDADLSHYSTQSPPSKREAETLMEASTAASLDLSGESLFDRLLLVLHGLLSSCQPSWLRLKPSSKSTTEPTKDFSGFDREVAENLQNELDCMQLPETIRWRIQAAMPIVASSGRCSVSCQPPSISSTALALLQPSLPIPAFHPGNTNQSHRNSSSLVRPGKIKTTPLQQDHDIEIDPWMLLEDGAGAGPSSGNTAVIGSSDHANLRASSWLRGTVRVRRMDLTYIGAVDDDS